MDTNNDNIFTPSTNYQISYCSTLGRFLVASRDIKKGEIILREQPLVSGPIKGTSVLCPGCYRSPNTNCPKCSWPICSFQCPGASIHEQYECKLYRSKAQKLKNTGQINNDDYWRRLSGCLMIVRCLLLKRIEARKWSNLLEMESNWGKWSRSSLYSTAKQIEDFLRYEYGFSELEYPSLDILRIQAILDINAYEVQVSESNIQAVYKTASLAEHNCTPNTNKSINADSLELIFRAATDIPKGSHISATYCDVLWPTFRRQKFLTWSKFFTCSCARCQSPSELGTQLASFVCVICYNSNKKNPLALPVFKEQDNWADVMKEYTCTLCNARFPALECQMTFKKADDELTELDKYASSEIVPIFEEWLRKWTVMEQILEKSEEMCEDNSDDRNGTGEPDQTEEIAVRRKTETCYARTTLLLHPQNSLVLDACHTLFLLYPNENSTLEQLKRKECFGTHLLKATKPLFTGISKFRGTISYELAMTKAAILVNQLEQSGLTDNLHHLAEEVLQLLGESLELLKYEPIDQPEGKLAETGARQFDQFASFFAELFPTLTRFQLNI